MLITAAAIASIALGALMNSFLQAVIWFRLDIKKNFFSEKKCKALDQAAQRGGEVTIPRGAQELLWYIGTWFSGQFGGRQVVGLDIFRGLFQP